MTLARNGPCVLCEMVAGREEASPAYEDEHVIAVMDLSPVTQGHLFVSASRRTGVSAIAQSWMPPPNRYDVGFARCEVSGESAVTALDPPETSCGERSAIKRRHQWLSVPPWDWERRRYRGSNRK